MTSPILGRLPERYNEFYYAALDYQGMAVAALHKAKSVLRDGNIVLAQKYIKDADQYKKLADASYNASIEIYRGNVDAAAEIAKGIYNGSKASVKYGANMVLGPWGCKAFDGVFLITDFAIDSSSIGLSEATKNAVYEISIKVIFDEIKLESLGNKTISDVLTKGATKTIGDSRLYAVLDEVLKNPEFEKALMSTLTKSTAYGVKELTKEQIKKIIRALENSLIDQGNILRSQNSGGAD